MTFPAPYLRLGYILPRFLAIGRNQHPPLEDGRDRPAHRGIQPQMLTGIRACNARHRTSLAQVGRPVLTRNLQQPAFLNVSATEIVAIKVWALGARWSFHVLIINLPL
jgi:hypothetical protein